MACLQQILYERFSFKHIGVAAAAVILWLVVASNSSAQNGVDGLPSYNAAGDAKALILAEVDQYLAICRHSMVVNDAHINAGMASRHVGLAQQYLISSSVANKTLCADAARFFQECHNSIVEVPTHNKLAGTWRYAIVNPNGGIQFFVDTISTAASGYVIGPLKRPMSFDGKCYKITMVEGALTADFELQSLNTEVFAGKAIVNKRDTDQTVKCNIYFVREERFHTPADRVLEQINRN